MEGLITAAEAVTKNGGVLGTLAFCLLIGIIWAVRNYPGRPAGETTGESPAIFDKLDRIEGRLSVVEKEMDDRVTREEFHQAQLQMARIEERMKSIDETGRKTAHNVQLITEFMYSYGKQK